MGVIMPQLDILYYQIKLPVFGMGYILYSCYPPVNGDVS